MVVVKTVKPSWKDQGNLADCLNCPSGKLSCSKYYNIKKELQKINSETAEVIPYSFAFLSIFASDIKGNHCFLQETANLHYLPLTVPSSNGR